MEKVNDLSRKIEKNIKKLIGDLEEFDRINEKHGFTGIDSNIFHLVNETAKDAEQEALYNYYIKPKIDCMVGRFDERYYPSLCDLLRTLMHEAGEYKVRPARRELSPRVFCFAFVGLCRRYKNSRDLPLDFMLTNKTMATFTNIVCYPIKNDFSEQNACDCKFIWRNWRFRPGYG